MKFHQISVLLLVVALVTLTHGQQVDIIERSLQLHSRLSVDWTVNFPQESVTFVVTAETKGFIGFGISPQGGMNNADVIIGGVDDNGVPYFTDRFATGKQEPKIDDHQDWLLLDARENSTHTVLTFNRSLETCDPEDLPITDDTTRFIWSLGESDVIAYHGENRGASGVNILDLPSPPVDVSEFTVWDITVNTTIPTRDTSYWCTVHKSPKFATKNQLVGFSVKLEGELALKHNHHMIVHKCDNAPPGSEAAEFLESMVGKPGGECYEDDGNGMMILQQYCGTYLYVWAVGGTPLFLPEDIGFPLNDDGAEEYFTLEIHYDNPTVEAGITYETGIEIYTTPNLRPIDAGLMIAGYSTDISLMIPPETDHYVTATHCSPRCTGERIPAAGINIFNVLHHTHLSGREVIVRHFREDTPGAVKELPWISYDFNYDFNFQQTRPLREHVKVLPGDQITVECTYNSSWRQPPSTTFGGLATGEEMCQAIMLYWPKMTTLDYCGSEMPKDVLWSPMGIEEVDYETNYVDPIVLKPAQFAGNNLSTVLNTLVDWTPQVRAALQELTLTSDHLPSCFIFANASGPTDDFITYPQNFEIYEPPPGKCDVRRQ